MKKFKSFNEKGFGGLEVIIFIVVIGLFVGLGWYVYTSNQKTNEKLDNLSKTTSSDDGKNTAQPNKNDNVFLFKEFGVQIPLTDSLKGLSYKVDKESGKLIITTDKFANALKICSPSYTGNADFVMIQKTSGQYPSEGNQTADDGELLKQFDAFYVSYNPNKGVVCNKESDDTAFAESLGEITQAFESAFKNATVVQ